MDSVEFREHCSKFAAGIGFAERVRGVVIDAHPIAIAAEFALEEACQEMNRRSKPGMDRMLVIQHDDDLAAGLEHAIDFVDRFLRIRGVVEHAERIDNIERIVRKRERFGIGGAEFARKSLGAEAFLGEARAFFGEIDPGYDRAVASELEGVGPHAASNFEEHFTSKFLEFAEPLHKGLRPIAESLDLIVKSFRARFERSELCAAGMGIPVIVNFRLDRGGCCLWLV